MKEEEEEEEEEENEEERRKSGEREEKERRKSKKRKRKKKKGKEKLKRAGPSQSRDFAPAVDVGLHSGSIRGKRWEGRVESVGLTSLLRSMRLVKKRYCGV